MTLDVNNLIIKDKRIKIKNLDLEIKNKNIKVKGKNLEIRSNKLNIRGEELKISGKNLKIEGKEIEIGSERLEIKGNDLEIEDTALEIVKDENQGIYSCFKIQTCNSMDYILVVKNKKNSKYYIYHLELKSEIISSENILKKHVISLESLRFILYIIYFKSIKDNIEIEDFPEKFYHKVIVFNVKKSGYTQNKIKQVNYNNISSYKGKFKNKYKYFTYGVICDSAGYSKDKIYLRNLFEEKESFSTEKLEIKEMFYI